MRESPNLTRKRSIPSNNTSDEIQFFGSGKSGTVLPKVSFPSQPEKNKICGDCLITNANLEVLKSELTTLRSDKDNLLKTVDRMRLEKDKSVDKQVDIVRLEKESIIMELKSDNKRIKLEGEKKAMELNKRLDNLKKVKEDNTKNQVTQIEHLRTSLIQANTSISDLESEKTQILSEKDYAIAELLKLLENRKEVRVKEEGEGLMVERLKKELEEEREGHKFTSETSSALISELEISINKLTSEVSHLKQDIESKDLLLIEREALEDKVEKLMNTYVLGVEKKVFVDVGVMCEGCSPVSPQEKVEESTKIAKMESLALSPIKFPSTGAPRAVQTIELVDSNLLKKIEEKLSVLKESIEEEVKGTRKHTHLLNLTQTSTNRDMKGEIQSLNLRLNAAEEQQKILIFCLDTAESKLGEVDFETAERLKKSRGERLKGVREKLGRELGELEQRSCSTSFMTGEKLRSLLPDAKKEWEKWKLKRIERIGELEKSVEMLKKNVKRTGISIN
ncbi:hypothetical protein TrLO_g2009 [Triparma laevis f. longispina]|nr:hypothetical protein TrLO_g2009 [Triparma laevis f. longispina]